MKKSFISAILALCVILPLSTTAIAADNTKDIIETPKNRIQSCNDTIFIKEVTILDYVLPDAYFFDPETASPDEYVFFSAMIVWAQSAVSSAQVKSKTSPGYSTNGTTTGTPLSVSIGSLNTIGSIGTLSWSLVIPNGAVPPNTAASAFTVTAAVYHTPFGVLVRSQRWDKPNVATSGTITEIPCGTGVGWTYSVTFGGSLVFSNGYDTYILPISDTKVFAQI